MGQAIKMATKTNLIKSTESSFTIPGRLAPKTFRIPISFVLCCVTNAARPNSPKQAINIANPANVDTMDWVLCTSAYSDANPSSKNEYCIFW